MSPPDPAAARAARTAHLQLALSMVVLGLNVPIGKVVVGEIAPVLFAVLRFALAGAILFAAAALMRLGRPRLDARGWGLLALQALFGVVLFTILMLEGLARTDAVSAGIILGGLPGVTALLSLVFLRERAGAAVLGAVALAGLGIALVSVAGAGTASPGTLAGNLLVLGAVVCEAVFIVIGRALAGRMAPVTQAAWLNLIGLVMGLPLLALVQPATDWTFLGDPGLIALMVLYVLNASVFSLLLWYRGLTRVSATSAGVMTAIIPATAALVAVVFLGSDVTWVHGAGFALIAAALLVSTQARPSTASMP